MRWSLTGVLMMGGLLVLPGGLRGNEADTKAARALAERIDGLMAERYKAKKATPTEPAEPAEFVRRAHLDLIGRIPDILAARDFLDNPDRDKHSKLIDKLLAHPRHPIHLGAVWRGILVPDAAENPFAFNARPQVEAFLRQEFEKKTPYDALVRNLITGGAAGFDPRLGGRGRFPGSAFLQAVGMDPEQQAGAMTRLFLGVKVECAQCHNHPFAKWTRKQFWETAAFFPSPARRPGAAVADGRKIEIPKTGKTVEARFLDGTVPAWEPASNSRVVFAEWATKATNPFFARASVNRVWEYLMGTGLVDPVDEGGPDNPPSHPEVIDELAKGFVEKNFDLGFVFRTIMHTRAYQLSSRLTDPSQADHRLFARQRVRGMSPEQLFDSLALATGQEDRLDLNPFNPRVGFPGMANDPRSEFLRRFPNQDKRSEQTTSILQALYLMNGRVVSDATSLRTNRNLAIIAEARSVRTSRRIEQLYLITLNRKPRPAESARLVAYVNRGGPTGDQALALCDVFWALLNSSEFCVNH